MEDVFESNETGAKVISASKATAVAQSKQGVGDEAYDFYLLLKSERMQGWTVPESLLEKLL